MRPAVGISHYSQKYLKHIFATLQNIKCSLKTNKLHKHRPQIVIAQLISKNIYGTPTATSCPRSLSVLFVPKHLPPVHMSVLMVSGCNQNSVKWKTERVFNSRCNNWKLVHRQHLRFLLFWMVLCSKKLASALLLSSYEFFECVRNARLQTFKVTVITSSTNSGFPLRPRFAATKLFGLALLCWSGSWSHVSPALFPRPQPFTGCSP